MFIIAEESEKEDKKPKTASTMVTLRNDAQKRWGSKYFFNNWWNDQLPQNVIKNAKIEFAKGTN